MGSISPNVLILEVVELVRPEVLRSRIKVTTQMEPGLPDVLGDRIQLQQVVLNLIMNSIEAIGAAGEGPRDIVIGARVYETNSILFWVQDSGVGIRSEDQDRLFEAFFTTKPDGMGMGLSISRSIVENHSGKLMAVKNRERGATFQFTLPLVGKPNQF
jgi:signal transduction histidine kinase